MHDAYDHGSYPYALSAARSPPTARTMLDAPAHAATGSQALIASWTSARAANSAYTSTWTLALVSVP